MSKRWQELSDELAELVEAHEASLVSVSSGRRRASGVVWSPDGLIITADRALGRDQAAEIRLSDGGQVPAAVVGRDPTTDLALLKVEGAALAAPRWSEGEDLKVGHLVLTLGRPGQGVRATLGLVSALGGPWRAPLGGRVDRYIEVDGRLPHGFSGGLLTDLGGGALGINTRGLVRGGTTVPMATVRRVVETLRTQGSVRRGYLGVVVHPVSLPATVAQQMGQARALLLASVEADGPADRAGFMLGDVLMVLDGESLETADALLALLADRGGAEAAARVLRAGQVIDVTVSIGERGGGRP